LAWSQSGVSLAGSVQDITDGIIAGAPLILYSADTEHIVDIVISDQEGEFKLADLSPGTYDLMVEEPGFKRQTIKNIKITDNPPGAISIKLQVGDYSGCPVSELKPGDLPAPTNTVSYEKRLESTQVFGVIHSCQNDRLHTVLPNAKVELVLVSKSGQPRVTESNDKGEFSFADLEPGKYELHASHEGYWNLIPVVLWVSRENLTRISADLVLPGKQYQC
jgi:hypothetical protein